MSEQNVAGSKDKGSWEAALEEYQEAWLRDTGGIGFFTFGSSVTLEDAPTECSSVRNARITFRTLMTFAARQRITYETQSTLGQTPNAAVRFDPQDSDLLSELEVYKSDPNATLRFDPQDADEADAGRGVIAELIFRLVHTDEKYFAEIVRLKKAFDSVGTDRDEITAKSALFLTARDLLHELDRDPTREEVLERLYKTTKHRPSDTSKLFCNAKLAFLKEKRGRPPKVRTRTNG